MSAITGNTATRWSTRRWTIFAAGTAIDARRAEYAKVWDQRGNDVPLIYLWINRNIMAMRQNLMGFNLIADGIIRLPGMQFAP